jgi:hypothetical protein
VALVHVLFAPLGNSLRVGSRSSWVSADEAGRVGCRLLPLGTVAWVFLRLFIHSPGLQCSPSRLCSTTDCRFRFLFCSAATAIPGARSLRLS